jgi:hypothetical protein
MGAATRTESLGALRFSARFGAPRRRSLANRLRRCASWPTVAQRPCQLLRSAKCVNRSVRLRRALDPCQDVVAPRGSSTRRLP